MKKRDEIGLALACGVPCRRHITQVETFRSSNSQDLQRVLNDWLAALRPDQCVQSIQYAATAVQGCVYYSTLIVYTELERLEEVLP